jgi:hypothetical protein
MVVAVRRYLVEGILRFSPGLIRGKPQIRVSWIERWQGVVPFSLLGASIFGEDIGWIWRRDGRTLSYMEIW